MHLFISCYCLFCIQELIKHTDKTHPEKEQLNKALEAMQVSHILINMCSKYKNINNKENKVVLYIGGGGDLFPFTAYKFFPSWITRQSWKYCHIRVNYIYHSYINSKQLIGWLIWIIFAIIVSVRLYISKAKTIKHFHTVLARIG